MASLAESAALAGGFEYSLRRFLDGVRAIASGDAEDGPCKLNQLRMAVQQNDDGCAGPGPPES